MKWKIFCQIDELLKFLIINNIGIMELLIFNIRTPHPYTQKYTKHALTTGRTEIGVLVQNCNQTI